MAIVDGKIRCGTCGEWKPQDAYAPAVYRRGHGTCRPCKNAQNRDYERRHAEKVAADRRAWNEKNREKVRARNLASYHRYAETRRARAREVYRADPGTRAAKHADHVARKYGISRVQYDALLLAQGGACALCARPPGASRRLAVDHDHETGRIRGLLCTQCNTAIGRFGDTAEGVQRVLDYLKERRGPCLSVVAG